MVQEIDLATLGCPGAPEQRQEEFFHDVFIYQHEYFKLALQQTLHAPGTQKDSLEEICFCSAFPTGHPQRL